MRKNNWIIIFYFFLKTILKICFYIMNYDATDRTSADPHFIDTEEDDPQHRARSDS